jgi:hypothetical protein
MKKLSKIDQRKLYYLYKDAIEGELSGNLQFYYNYGYGESEVKLRETAQQKLKLFLSSLENNIE